LPHHTPKKKNGKKKRKKEKKKERETWERPPSPSNSQKEQELVPITLMTSYIAKTFLYKGIYANNFIVYFQVNLKP
jgi:hypothetical protein